MNKLLQLFLIIGIMVVLVSCSPTSKTEDSSIEPPTVPAVKQEETKPEIKPEVKTEEKLVEEKIFHSIVIGGILIGGSLDNTWIGRDEVAENINGLEKYSLYSLNKYVGEGLGSKLYFSDASGCELINIEYNDDLDIDIVGVQAEWNAMPRISFEEDCNKQEYINIVSEVLKGYGLNEVPVLIKQVVKTDFEGDGIEELLISAENITANYVGENGEVIEPAFDQCRLNTYSIVVLVKQANGDAEYIEVIKSTYTDEEQIKNEIPYVDKIVSIIDLNGDGRMEIVVGYFYYEGHGYAVYEIKDNELDLVYANVDGL